MDMSIQLPGHLLYLWEKRNRHFWGGGGCCVGPQLVWVLWEKAKCVVSVGAVQFINYYLIITKQTDCGANRAFCSRVWGISTGDKAVRT